MHDKSPGDADSAGLRSAGASAFPGLADATGAWTRLGVASMEMQGWLLVTDLPLALSWKVSDFVILGKPIHCFWPQFPDL